MNREDAKNAKSPVDRQRIEHVASAIVDSAMAVHLAIGPGCLESAYEACMVHELRGRGFKVLTQVELPIVYRGVRIEVGYRIDLLVEDAIIVELKTVEKLVPIHDAQLLSYLRLSGRKLGFLINFHVPLLKDGLKRLVNGL